MTEIVNINVSNKSIGFTVDKKELGDFISGLLGQPQSLERRFDAPFSVDHQWFLHFFSMIQQRIQQQNSPEPLSFEATVNYRGGMLRKLTTWDAFEHFSETLNCVSISAKFHLAFLIQFNGKQVPERQEIIIDFDSKYSNDSIFDILSGRSSPVGSIEVEIRHTERTWADDLFRLIESEISSIQISETRIKKRIQKIFLPFASFSFPLMMFASVVYSTWSKRGDGDAITNKLSYVHDAGKKDISELHDKVDILLSEVQKKAHSQLGDGAVFLYSLIFAALLFFGGVLLARPSPSFVLLTREAERNKKITLDKLKRKNFWLFISILGSIVLGVIGNFVYDYIK